MLLYFRNAKTKCIAVCEPIENMKKNYDQLYLQEIVEELHFHFRLLVSLSLCVSVHLKTDERVHRFLCKYSKKHFSNTACYAVRFARDMRTVTSNADKRKVKKN